MTFEALRPVEVLGYRILDVAAMSMMTSHEVLNIEATGTMKKGTWLPLNGLGNCPPLN